MKTWISVLLLAVFMVNLVGCSNMTPPREGSSRAYIGMFSGAIAGGLVGSNFGENRGGRVGVIAFSALVGGVFGGALGMLLDATVYQRDQALANGCTPPLQSANSWRKAGHPLALQIEKPKQAVAVMQAQKKASPSKTVATQKLRAKSPAVLSAKEKISLAPLKTLELENKPGNKNASSDDKVSSRGSKMPSTQWFVNDGQQEDLG